MVIAKAGTRRGLAPKALCSQNIALIAAVACSLVLAACQPMSSSLTRTTRPISLPTAALELELLRGSSTKADVETLLGPPDGSGSLLFPTQNDVQEIWYYERVEFKQAGQSFDIEQDVLLMFFHGDVYEGFMWFSDAEWPESATEDRP